MDERVWWVGGALGLVAVVVLANRGGGGGSRLTTLGPLPAPDDSADLSARTSAFGRLVDYAETTIRGQTTLGVESLRANAAADIARVQAGVENRRIGAALESSRLQNETARQVARTQARAQNKKGFWDTVGNIGGALIGAIF